MVGNNVTINAWNACAISLCAVDMGSILGGREVINVIVSLSAGFSAPLALHMYGRILVKVYRGPV